MLISTTQGLAAFCQAQKGADFVTVDTEFMRERTYWPKLCLVQLAGPKEAVAVDPLAPDMDLAPLYALMNDDSLLKVFHAARQDVEIFVNATGKVPAPLVDTQVAAMVCGFGDSVSYAALVESLANAKIDKSSQFTDWARRPLTDKQITYALGDVTHLRLVYKALESKLEASGRRDWVREEMAVLTDPATYLVDPYEMWRRLKLRGNKPVFRALVRELAAWREREAQRLDVPRARVMKDETLMEIAYSAPSAPQELSRARGLSNGMAEGRQGREILEAIERVRAMPASTYPASIPQRSIPNGTGAILDLLRVLLKQVSERHGVAAKLIASADDLEVIAVEKTPDVKPLKGWRGEIFGQDALALKRGDLALAVKDRRVVLLGKDKGPNVDKGEKP